MCGGGGGGPNTPQPDAGYLILSHILLLSLPLSLSPFLNLWPPLSFNSIYVYIFTNLSPYSFNASRKRRMQQARARQRLLPCASLPRPLSTPPRPSLPPTPPPQARGATGGPASQPISAPGQLKHHPCCVDTSAHRVTCLLFMRVRAWRFLQWAWCAFGSVSEQWQNLCKKELWCIVSSGTKNRGICLFQRRCW